MRNKVAHINAGFCIGLVLYAIFLGCFTLLVAPNTTYWLAPIPNDPSYNTRAAIWSMLWQFHRLQVIAISMGLPFPLFFAGISYILAVKRRMPWVQRWYVQVGFAISGLIAAWQILEKITVIIPVPLYYLID